MGYDWGMGWSMGAGMLFMALFWVFIVAAAVWLALTLTRQTGDMDRRARGRAPIGLLEERLARGEIEVEEFRARRAALEEAGR